MSEKYNLNNLDFSVPEDINRWRTLALGVGGIATIIVLVVALIFPDQREYALRSWLFGFIFWCGIGIGCLGLLILQYLTGGAWGVISRRIFEAGSRTLPILLILFLPVLLGVSQIYEWVHLENDPIVQHRGAYLNPLAWGLRALLYFGMWAAMMFLLNKWSDEQDRTGEFDVLTKMSRFSGPTLVFFGLVVSFAAIDWVMTLDPHWFSTIFGLLYMIGWGLSAIAFTILLLSWFVKRSPMNQIVGKKHFHDLGKLMLAMVMVWAYFNFSQFLIIWSGNLPEETTWYLTRMKGTWGAIGLILIIFHFAFPFLFLLSRDVKRNSRWLAALAAFILVMRFVDYYYIIAPTPTVSHHGEAGTFSFLYLVTPFAVGGIWLWWFFGELKKRPLLPLNDPYLENAIAHAKEH